MALTPRDIGRALAHGIEVEDADFDAYLSVKHRSVSGQFWTPVSVAATAGRWLSDVGAGCVLDVGSGAGKFCVAAALASSGLDIIGVEQRPELIVAATALARRFEVEDRTRFVAGTIDDIPLTAFDALYLFNPFAENVFPRSARLDESIALGDERMRRDVSLIEDALAAFEVGRAVVTYHGFGGRLPDTFDPVREQPMGTDVLRLWIKKRRETSRGAYWIEAADGVALRMDGDPEQSGEIAVFEIETGPDLTNDGS